MALPNRVATSSRIQGMHLVRRKGYPRRVVPSFFRRRKTDRSGRAQRDRVVASRLQVGDWSRLPPRANAVPTAGSFPPAAFCPTALRGVGSEEARPAGAGLRPPLKRYVQFSRIPLSRRRSRMVRTDGRNQTDKVDRAQLAVERGAGQGLPSPTPPPSVPIRPQATHHPTVELVQEPPNVGTLVVVPHPRRAGLSCRFSPPTRRGCRSTMAFHCGEAGACESQGRAGRRRETVGEQGHEWQRGAVAREVGDARRPARADSRLRRAPGGRRRYDDGEMPAEQRRGKRGRARAGRRQESRRARRNAIGPRRDVQSIGVIGVRPARREERRMNDSDATRGPYDTAAALVHELYIEELKRALMPPVHPIHPMVNGEQTQALIRLARGRDRPRAKSRTRRPGSGRTCTPGTQCRSKSSTDRSGRCTKPIAR